MPEAVGGAIDRLVADQIRPRSPLAATTTRLYVAVDDDSGAVDDDSGAVVCHLLSAEAVRGGS
jgi:hypothetical protein